MEYGYDTHGHVHAHAQASTHHTRVHTQTTYPCLIATLPCQVSLPSVHVLVQCPSFQHRYNSSIVSYLNQVMLRSFSTQTVEFSVIFRININFLLFVTREAKDEHKEKEKKRKLNSLHELKIKFSMGNSFSLQVATNFFSQALIPM